MTTWTRKPQEQEGSYLFSGNFYITRGVANSLSEKEILDIYFDILSFVKEKGSVDYLQVYVSNAGGKLFFIDQLDKDMIASGAYAQEDNYCTLLLPEEY